MEREEYILLGESVPIPELEDEESELYPLKAWMNFNMVDVVSAIGSKRFQGAYLTSKTVIDRSPLRHRIIFAMNILERISEVYDFEFMSTPLLYTNSDVDEVIEFIKFLEYECMDFLTAIWKEVDVPLNKINNIFDFCELYSDKIITIIDANVYPNTNNWMIADFIRTNNKENMILYISEKTSQYQMLIYTRIVQERMDENV